MHISLLFSAFVYILVAYGTYRLVNSVLIKYQRAAKAKALGCKNAPVQLNQKFLGLDRVQEATKADREMAIPWLMEQKFKEMKTLTFEHSLFGRHGFTTIDPKNVQAILATQFDHFGLGSMRRSNFFPLLGNGIFTSDGKSWEHSRALLRPQFAREQVSDLELEERHSKNLMRAIPIGKDGWTDSIDLQPLFFRLTLDSATEFLFGESVDSQLAALPGYKSKTNAHVARDEKVFAKAFDFAQQMLAKRGRFRRFHWMIGGKDFKAACKQSHEFIDSFVTAALNKDRQETELEKGGSKGKYHFLDGLVEHTRDPVELRSQLLNILLAGRDTTASLLGWIFYTLARHPTVYEKLRATIIEAFGTFDSGKEITFSTIKSCQYLQYCVNETLRLYPIVPLNSRQAKRDTTLPRGGGPDGLSPVFVSKGTIINYFVYNIHRRKDIWGEDADDFKPERWEGRKIGWEYLPFNGGPRICIGQQFAITEASYMTIRLLQRFDKIENTDPEPTIKYNLNLTMCSGTGAKVRMHEASKMT
ncbi:MAG: hypothetical protein M1829_005167 [Trizodia sp. TS-e1964]|nr:MAG: hypothetical protein M1829_005167 [Trizodia sp. TS-e1964]